MSAFDKSDIPLAPRDRPKDWSDRPKDYQPPVANPLLQAAARKKTLGVLAILLILVMGVIASAGLDNLPGELRDSVNAASGKISNDKSTFEGHRAYLDRALREEPELFAGKAADWTNHLKADQAKLATAEQSLAALVTLAAANKRSDTDQVERGLRELDANRTAAVTDADQLRQEAQRWIGYKKELPSRLTAMQRTHDAIAAFDVAPAARKAIADWPAKKGDLEARVAALVAAKAAAEATWTGSAAVRALAAQPSPKGLDYGALFQSADRLDQTQAQLTTDSKAVDTLAGQLYTNWDKLLLEVDGGREKVKIVRTKFPDATLANGVVSQEEMWEPLDARLRRDRDQHAGMVVERKPAGKYDSEAERVVQAPAYAYIAPPGQANSYGSWNNGVWSWLPQYLIMRELLQPRMTTPITIGDYNAYDSARRRGDTWYGPRDSFRTNRPTINSDNRSYTGNSGGGFYREREKPSFGNKSYSDSRYQSRGSYSSSRYQSRGTFSSRPSGRSFGGGRGRR
ncbi:MAG: hypothetical protein NTV70_24335 [Acidobacteria bacterium]|nr:hypothetical protein [Acidobacteriota bacterium]